MSNEDDKDSSLVISKLKHNLRTPINHIIGYSEILLEDFAEYKDELLPSVFLDTEKIHSCGKQLLHLVNDIFTPGKYKNEFLEIEAAQHDLCCHLNSIIDCCEILPVNLQATQHQLFGEDLSRIHSASKSLYSLLEQILNRGVHEPLAVVEEQVADEAPEDAVLIPTFINGGKEGLAKDASRTAYLILVVDDDKNNRDLLSRRLADLGYEVKCAQHGQQALEMMQTSLFDLVLLDVMMPVLDGYQTLQRIKSDSAFREIPVIMISALDDIAVVSACIEMGAEDYLPKSFDVIILKARISASLERKRLRQGEREMLDYLQKELRTAGKIQANMLPSQFPLFPQLQAIDLFALMIPARQVGGDFYDAFLIDKNKIFIAVGDVSGKGISAALFMVQSMTHLRTQALKALPPDQILYEVNNLLCLSNDAGMFVTLFCGILDLETGRFSYSNAGHIAPVLDGGNGHMEFIHLPFGVVAGVMEDTNYSLEYLDLMPGQTLFVYTDGVTEAENPQLELYSASRLLDFMASSSLMGAKTVVDRVRKDISGFVKDAAQSDDITMLALRYLG